MKLKNPQLFGKLLLTYLKILSFFSETTALLNPQISVFINSVILTILLIAASIDKISRNLLTSFSIIPTVRLIEFAIPSEEPFVRRSLIYFIILTLCYAYKFCLGIKKTGHTLKKVSDLPLMILLGVLIGSLAYILLPNDKLNLGITINLELLILLVFCFVLFGYTEEFLFRGLIQSSTEKFTKPLFAILFTSILYSFVHISSGLSGVVFAFLLSLINSIVFYRKRNIFLPTALNATMNIVIFLLSNNLLIINF